MGKLGELAQLAADPALQMPALMIIGEVVELADSLNWFEPNTVQQATDLDAAKAL
jgi:uroporphyrin-III C-methyltransferase